MSNQITIETASGYLPQAMDRPVIYGTCSGIAIPELCLQQKTARVVEAAGVGDGAFVVATQGVLEGAALL